MRRRDLIAFERFVAETDRREATRVIVNAVWRFLIRVANSRAAGL